MEVELRKKLIRLAYQQPQLRSTLLPLIKTAYSRIPEDYIDFGYSGVGAKSAGNEMALLVQGEIERMKEQARVGWKNLASHLMANEDVDLRPELSRTVVALALEDTYAELTSKAKKYFSQLP